MRARVRIIAMIAPALACTVSQPGDVGVAGKRTSAAISEQDARQRLFAIAHDSMGGRATGSPGHISVTEYIAGEMRRLDLEPGGDSGTYFQRVPLIKWKVVSASLAIDGQQLAAWEDFAPSYPGGPTRSFDGAQVIYGGILQDTLREITREQARGKFVILLNSDPNPAANIRTAAAGSRLETAAAVATVNSARGMAIWRYLLRDPNPVLASNAPASAAQPATLSISPETAARLLGTTLDTLLPPGRLGRIVHGRIEFRAEPVEARNVIAVLRGADPGRHATYIAIGAHSDHIRPAMGAFDHDSLHAFNAMVRRTQIAAGGRRLTREERAAIRVNVDSLRAIGPARLDSINNGADDDGSGTVALLEIAEAMAGARRRPARSVLFIWHAAEELGLIGSRHFTDHPTVPLDSITALLNLDMVGRGGAGEEAGGGPAYLQLIGWRRLSSELGSTIEQANQAQERPFSFDLQYDQPGHPEQFYCRSDHYMYARHAIPISFFTTGGHGDYHQVTDEPQYVDYGKLSRVARLVRDVALRLADLDHPPAVDGKRPDPSGECVQ